MGKQAPLAGKNPLEDLVKEQAAIAAESAELAKIVKPEIKQAQQGADAAKTAAAQLKIGRIEPTKEAGKLAAQKLEQLGQSDIDMAQRKTAGDLAHRQEEVIKALEKLAGDPRVAAAQQADQQKKLQGQTQELAQKIQRLAQQTKENANASGSKSAEAVKESKEAESDLKAAVEKNAKGDPSRLANPKARPPNL